MFLMKIKNNKSKVTFPESTMNLMPSIVMEVSAMFVDTTHLRTPSGGTSKTYRPKNVLQHSLCPPVSCHSVFISIPIPRIKACSCESTILTNSLQLRPQTSVITLCTKNTEMDILASLRISGGVGGVMGCDSYRNKPLRK